jgi:hypothetical protein
LKITIILKISETDVSPHIVASRFLFYAIHQANDTTQRISLANHHYFLALSLTLLQCRFEAFHPAEIFVCHLDHNRRRKFCWLQIKCNNLSETVNLTDNRTNTAAIREWNC